MRCTNLDNWSVPHSFNSCLAGIGLSLPSNSLMDLLVLSSHNFLSWSLFVLRSCFSCCAFSAEFTNSVMACCVSSFRDIASFLISSSKSIVRSMGTIKISGCS